MKHLFGILLLSLSIIVPESAAAGSEIKVGDGRGALEGKKPHQARFQIESFCEANEGRLEIGYDVTRDGKISLSSFTIDNSSLSDNDIRSVQSALEKYDYLYIAMIRCDANGMWDISIGAENSDPSAERDGTKYPQSIITIIVLEGKISRIFEIEY